MLLSLHGARSSLALSLSCALLGLACSEPDGADPGGSGGQAGSAPSGGGGTAAASQTGGSAGAGASAGAAGAAGIDAGVEAGIDAGVEAGTAPVNAIWVWSSADFVEPAARSKLLAFALARGASRLFVNGSPALVPSSSSYAPAAWRAGLDEAATQGIGVDILVGDASWTSPGNAQSWAIANLIGPIASFYADPLTKTKPVALHLDVEPHGLDAWKNGSTATKQALIADLCSFYELARSTLDQGGAGSLQLHADLPSWWDSATYTFSLAGKTATGYEHALGRLDAAALMAYSNKVSAVLGNSAVEMELTDKTAKRIWIGVETNPSYADVALATKPELESGLAAIQGAYAGRPGYGGWAVHAYSYWSGMPGY